jgi:hypothetical protein
MSLAGIALLRSVDTTVMVSGNIALKQSTILGADQGTQAAVAWLESKSSASLQMTQETDGYFSSLPLPDPANWFDDGVWTDAKVVNGGVADAAGNRLSYLIHRQCSQPDMSYEGTGGVTNQCAAIDESIGGSVLTEGDSFRAGVGNVFARAKKVYYRISTRVQGPRNSVSIIQTTVAVQA